MTRPVGTPGVPGASASRPGGEPAALAGGARALGAAAEALGDVRQRLRGATSFVVAAGAWKGPASEAFLLDGARSQAALDRAADALGQAAGALAELAARLEHAQATWDRAHALAATVGVDLDRGGAGIPPAAGVGAEPRGRLLAPTGAVDLAVTAVADEAMRLAEAANQEAAAARRAAAARLDQAAATAGRVAAGRGHAAATAGPTAAGLGHAAAGAGHGLPERGMVGRALEAGAEVAAATHHLVAGAEARVRAATRLAVTADDPAVRAAAGRVAETAGRSLLDGRVLGALPLVAPALDFAAAVSDGEPPVRALVGAIGGAVGADIGGRVGLAACGGEAAATQGAGLIVCPTLTAVGGAIGSHAGRTAALHLYDKVAGPPDPPKPARGAP